MTLAYAWRLVLRNPRRSVTVLFGLALAVGLFAGILFFVDVTARQMTETAIAPVKLDLVAHATTPTLSTTDLVNTIQNQKGIAAVEPVYVTDFNSAQKVGGTKLSPAGRLFSISPSYFSTFDVIQISEGTFNAQGVLISEAMSISQNLKIGDQVSLTFSGIDQPVKLPVTGIVNMNNADALFSTAAESENAVVADVVFVDNAWFEQSLLQQLTPMAANPPASLPTGSILLDQQVHIQINRSLLPSDPTRAAVQTESLRRQVERQYPGDLKTIDNLSGALKSAKSDVLSAKILFIFLGLPGVALAAYLSKFTADLFSEAQRREIGLLRTRGASPNLITGIVAVSSALLASAGSFLGIIFGLFISAISIGSPANASFYPFSNGFEWGAFGNSAIIAFFAGILLTFFATFLPTFNGFRREITQERRMVRRVEQTPFWKKSYLDLIMLFSAAVVLFITQLNGGFKPSGNEGAVISLSFYIFLAPFFAWIGITLLTLRLVTWRLSAASQLFSAFFGKLFGEIGEVAGKSISRRAARISGAITIIALTLSFGISLSLFQNTYSYEKRLDAQYVVGSDIRFTPALNTPQNQGFASNLQITGVTGVSGVARDTQALIGSEKNTVYGINVDSFSEVAYLPDSFFVDGTAQKTLDALHNHTMNYAPGSAATVLQALKNTPNGVIISVEQAEKYNIQVGDPVLMKLYNPQTKQYSDIKTQAVGLFEYFPTSSQDSDFILNLDFMMKASGTNAVNYFLIKTDGKATSVSKISDALKTQYQNTIPVQIQNINTVIKTEESSLTSMNLGGLGRMELLYTIVVISAGLTIFLLAMINERQREFGAMRALGADLTHLRRFLFAEAATIGGLSLFIGAIVGTLLARLLVLILAVIFTIPARGLVIPGVELLILAALVIAGMVFSTIISTRRLSSLKVVETLREL